MRRPDRVGRAGSVSVHASDPEEELRQLGMARPAAARRAASRRQERRRGVDGARRHAAPDGRLHHPQAVRHRRPVRRRPRPLHHPLQHRVHGELVRQGRSR